MPCRTQRGAGFILLISCLVASSFSVKKLEVIKKVGNLTVEVRLEKDPPIVGKNAIEIRIYDERGETVQERKVFLNYYMPPMPRMVPMNFKAEAKWKKDSYQARLNLIMAGPWIIILRIIIGDKTTSTKFQIDVH